MLRRPRAIPLSPRRHYELAMGLPEGELAALIRGVILVSQALRSTYGSGSPVIALYKAYRERFPESEPTLTRWIIEYRSNEYEPFGTVVNNSARSWEAFLTRTEADRMAAANEAALRLARDETARAERRAGEAVKATERLRNAVRRGDTAAVAALLTKGADWRRVVQEHGSLIAYAQECGRTDVVGVLQAHGVA